MNAAGFPQLRLLFAGSRRWTDAALLRQELEQAWREGVELYGLGTRLVVVHGDCPEGADPVAHAWAQANRRHGVTPEPHPADWDHCAPTCPPGTAHRRTRRPGDRAHPGTAPTYCPGAGPRRNAHMVGLGAGLMLAAPAPTGPSYGTWNCMRLAAHADIPVRTITLEGSR